MIHIVSLLRSPYSVVLLLSRLQRLHITCILIVLWSTVYVYPEEDNYNKVVNSVVFLIYVIRKRVLMLVQIKINN